MAAWKIAVIDGSASIAYAFRKTFEKAGWLTLTASAVPDGLELVEREHPDVVFMDVAVPGMDGPETIKRIHQIQPGLPVVIITGFGTAESAVRDVRPPAFECLTKPLDVEEVRGAVRRALGAA